MRDHGVELARLLEQCRAYPEAAEWYRRAANAGEVQASLLLGRVL